MRAIVSVLLLALVSCSGGSQGVQMNTEIERGSMPEGGNWAGIWFTSWGELSITKTGSSVIGSFCQEDRNRYGRFEGTANGDVMSFRWITNDVTMAGARRESEGSAIVQFSFVPAGENQTAHFEGTWGFNRSNINGGPLRGDRSPSRSDRFLRGQYTLSCPLRAQTERSAPMSNEDVGDNPGDDGGRGPEEESGSVLDDF